MSNLGDTPEFIGAIPLSSSSCVSASTVFLVDLSKIADKIRKIIGRIVITIKEPPRPAILSSNAKN